MKAGPMDNTQFDAMTETIGTASSRRVVFAALLGGALAAVGADTLAQELGVEVKGDGETCRDDDECGRGLFCKRIKKKSKSGRSKKKSYECRYIDGCGERNDYCDETDDCCSRLRCDRNKNRCVND
jgi:hypothetical protein